MSLSLPVPLRAPVPRYPLGQLFGIVNCAARRHSFFLLNKRSASTATNAPRLVLQGPEASVARQWLEKFKSSTIKKDEVALSFARSSGPGGQNVNKVNTKAIVRCPINSPWIPSWAHDILKTMPSYVSSSQSLVFASTAHRSQAQNVEDCLKKVASSRATRQKVQLTMLPDSQLQLGIAASILSSIRNDPSEAQKEHVRNLQRLDKIRTRMGKEKRKEKKGGRSQARYSDD